VRFLGPILIPGIFAAIVVTTGCSPLAITALGVGGSAGVNHAMNGASYRTFTAPMPMVRVAAVQALGRMGIHVDNTGKQNEGELIKASASDRNIEIELEAISANATRMRSVTKRGVFSYDTATSDEILQQTEKLLKPQSAGAQRVSLPQGLASVLW